MIKKIFFSIGIFVSIFGNSQNTAKVVGIKDGDTIEILLSNKTTKVLRLAEVDCPESSQPFGKNARQFTSKEVFGKMITYYEIDTDRYGRTIAKIYYNDKKYLSEELIKNGFGWWYERYSKDKYLSDLQDSAKVNKIGLWQDKNAISPYEWRMKNKVTY